MTQAITHAISVMQPWPWAIFHLGKDIENRPWALPAAFAGVDVLLHTGLKRDTADTWEWIRRVGGRRPPHSKLLPRGALIGTIRFSGSVQATGPAAQDISPWAFGLHCWRIAAATEFPRPIPCKGQLKFWRPKEWTGLVPMARVEQRGLFGGGS